MLESAGCCDLGAMVSLALFPVALGCLSLLGLNPPSSHHRGLVVRRTALVLQLSLARLAPRLPQHARIFATSVLVPHQFGKKSPPGRHDPRRHAGRRPCLTA